MVTATWHVSRPLERENVRVKGKRQNLKGETRLQRDILANANNVAEQAAAANALKAGDEAAASVMAVQEQHDADYDPHEDKDNTNQSTLTENQSLLASHYGVAVINQHARRQWGHDIVGSTVGLGNLQNGQNGHQSPLSFDAAGSVSRPRLGVLPYLGTLFCR